MDMKGQLQFGRFIIIFSEKKFWNNNTGMQFVKMTDLALLTFEQLA